MVKSADTVSLIRLSAVVNVVHSIYIRKFSLKEQYKIESLVPTRVHAGEREKQRQRKSKRRGKKEAWKKRDGETYERVSERPRKKGERECQ